MWKISKGILATFLFFETVTAANAATFSDDDAKVFLERQWNADTLAVPIGEFAMQSTDAVATAAATAGTPRPLTQSEANVVQVLNSVGAVAAKKRAGKKGTLVVTPTPAGLEFNTSTSKDFLKIPIGQFAVDEVIKNEPYEILIDDYRVVMVNYSVNWNKTYLQYMSKIGVTLLPDRKAQLLLKFDPFAHRWDYVVGDFANKWEPFTSALVLNALRQLR